MNVWYERERPKRYIRIVNIAKLSEIQNHAIEGKKS